MYNHISITVKYYSMKNKVLTCGSFFSGVGGIDLGFELTKKFKTIYANEFNLNAASTYEENFKLKVDTSDIRILDEKKLKKFDVLLAGFPCQPFSVAGYREGFNDLKGRGNLFFELIRIIKEIKPKIVFLENVKNYLTHDHGNTMRITLELLQKNGYYYKYKVLNASEYGNIPQNRERIYIVGFKSKKVFEKFEFPKPIKLSIQLNDILLKEDVDKKFYYTSENCYFYNSLLKDMKINNTLYQWRRIYLRENKSNLSPTLTANMGSGGHNVPIYLSPSGIRKITPRECFKLQGFGDDFVLPKKLSSSTLYMQAGNSVVVSVIKRIAQQIIKAHSG
jgi:DNA (cytosine-5)-methyltransferase 1